MPQYIPYLQYHHHHNRQPCCKHNNNNKHNNRQTCGNHNNRQPSSKHNNNSQPRSKHNNRQTCGNHNNSNPSSKHNNNSQPCCKHNNRQTCGNHNKIHRPCQSTLSPIGSFLVAPPPVIPGAQTGGVATTNKFNIATAPPYVPPPCYTRSTNGRSAGNKEVITLKQQHPVVSTGL